MGVSFKFTPLTNNEPVPHLRKIIMSVFSSRMSPADHHCPQSNFRLLGDVTEWP